MIAIQLTDTDLGQIAPGNCMKCSATEGKHAVYQTGILNISKIYSFTKWSYLIFPPAYIPGDI